MKQREIIHYEFKEWIYAKIVYSVYKNDSLLGKIGWHSGMSGFFFEGYFIGGIRMICFRLKRRLQGCKDGKM